MAIAFCAACLPEPATTLEALLSRGRGMEGSGADVGGRAAGILPSLCSAWVLAEAAGDGGREGGAGFDAAGGPEGFDAESPSDAGVLRPSMKLPSGRAGATAPRHRSQMHQPHTLTGSLPERKLGLTGLLVRHGDHGVVGEAVSL
jgi:hypothetical protein